jgi:photosystem II stability/assembly factor-like uncharacterized protein
MTDRIKSIIFFFIIFTNSSFTQWLPTNGPDNGSVGGIYVKDSLIFAATQDYVHSSSDKGASWKQINNGFLYNSVISITGKGSYLFAGTSHSGLYRSSDLGNSWSAVRGILPTINISSFAWDKSNLFLGGLDGVYKTKDFGKNWTLVTSVPLENSVTAVYAEDSIIIVGMKDAGLKISKDSGKTWNTFSQGLVNRTVYSFLKMDTVLFVGTDSGVFSNQQFDGVWEKMDSLLSRVHINAMIRIGTRIVAATSKGIITSDDGWKTWKYVLYRQWTANYLSLAEMNGELYAGSASRGIYRSRDTGSIWIPTSAVTKKMTIESMVVRDSLIVAGSMYGVGVSMNEGGQWHDLSSDSVDIANAVAVHDSIVYAGNYLGLHARKLTGVDWKLMFSKTPVHCVKTQGDSIYVGGRKGLYFSPDNGSTFTLLDSLFYDATVYTLGVFGNTIFAGTGNGIYRSSDHGKHWSLAVPSPDNYWVADFVKNDSFYYAATGYGVFRMRMNDTVWTASLLGLNGTNDVAAICLNGDNIFLGLRGGGIVYSTNGGDVWKSGNSGFTQYMNVFAIGVNARRLFFGGAYSSVWSGTLVDLGITTVPSVTNVPLRSDLSQNYPNPFNPSTQMEFTISRASLVTLVVYDMLGREVTQLVNEQKDAGRYSVRWDASAFSAGMYFARLQAGDYTAVRKLLLLK